MNLLAIRIGRHNNYWSYLGNFFTLRAGSLSSGANIGSCHPDPRYGPTEGLRVLDNCLFNFDYYDSFPSYSYTTLGSVTRTFFYYSNSYGIFFILPIFSPIKYSNAPWSTRGFLGQYFKSFFLSRITFSKSFILPHNDIDYLLNTFIYRFLKKKKSFASTAFLLTAPTAAKDIFPTPAPGPFGARAGFQGRAAYGLSDFILGLKIVCHGRLNPRSSYRPGTIAPVFTTGANTAESFGRGSISLTNSSRKKSFEVQYGYLPNNSSYPPSTDPAPKRGRAPRQTELSSSGRATVGGGLGLPKRYDSINSINSTDIQPISYRFKPFYTQKGSNSFHLYISYKNFL